MKSKCKRGADGKTWRRLKKMAIEVFENLLKSTVQILISQQHEIMN